MKRFFGVNEFLKRSLCQLLVLQAALGLTVNVCQAGDLGLGGTWKRENSGIESEINDILFTQTIFGKRREYVDKTYVCWNFANDNCQQFRELGYGCWNFNFGCSANAPWGTSLTHAVNIVDFTDSGVEPGHRRLCLIEPQSCMIEEARESESETTMVIGCWIVEGREGDTGSVNDKSLEPLLMITMPRLKERYKWFNQCSDSIWSDSVFGICDHNVTGALSEDCHSRGVFDNSIFQLPF